jgi:hypothetical protein
LHTPTTGDVSENYDKRHPSGKPRPRPSPNLAAQIALLPTPTAQDAGRGANLDWKPIRPSGHHAQLSLQDKISGDKIGLKLQPAFVEWMMGFPEGWTELPDSKLLEMRSSRKSRRK